MLELKNRIYNSKERKKEIRLYKYMELMKKFRLKTKSIIPFSFNEELLYSEEGYNQNINKEDDGKYLELNGRMHLLTVIDKEHIEDFYNGYNLLVKSNPCKSIMSCTILDDTSKDNILRFKNKINSGGWSNLGYISPNSKLLKDVIDYIHMFLFDLSDDYVGVSFTLKINDNLNKEINNFMINDIDYKYDYRIYYNGSKKRIGRSIKNKEIVRKEKLDDILLEIKMRTYDFLNSYINLFPIGDNSPITLDEYRTDYNLKEGSKFLRSYDFHIFSEKFISKDLNIIINSNEDDKFNQLFEKVDFYFELGNNNLINRSARLLINISKNKSNNMFDNDVFITMYKCMFSYYLNNELEYCIRSKRKILSDSFNKKVNNICDKYISINKNINIYSSILSTLKLEKFYDYSDKYINDILKHQGKRYEKLSKKNKELNNEFSNVIMSKSTKSSLKLSKISIIIALLSLLITMVFSILSYFK